jgi:adenosylhomocysteine nucleosidase
VSCGSGDSFVTSEPELMTDIVDMEAFALAKFAIQTDLDFHCFKYISDGADNEAPKSWKENVINSSELFIKEVLE